MKLFKIGKIKKTTMKRKLTTFFILLTFIPILVIILSTAPYIRISAKNDFVKSSTQQIIQVDNYVSEYFNSVSENLEFLTSDPVLKDSLGKLPKYMDKSDDSQLKLSHSTSIGIEKDIFEEFNNFGKAHPKTSYVYIALNDGSYVQWPEETLPKNYDPRERPYYKQAMDNVGKITITDPYYWQPINSGVISTVKTIENNGKPIGVIGIDSNLTGITTMLKDMSIGEHGYVILTDAQGNIIAHPKHDDMIFKSISELSIPELNDLNDTSSKITSINIDNTPSMANIYTSPKTGWKFIAVIPEKEIYNTANNITILLLILSVITVLGAIVLGLTLSRKISKPIEETSSYLDLLQNGDFTQNVPESILKQKDEIGDLGNATQNMKTGIASLVNDVKNSSSTINQTVDVLNRMSDLSTQAINDITEAIEQIANSATDQASSLENGVKRTSEISESIRILDKSTLEMENISQTNKDLSDNGLTIIKTLINKSNEVNSSTKEVDILVKEMSNMSKQISVITDSIVEIAEQTNLLALNASIEAARAGEHGKGFAVVANEVRNLAEESGQSADNIKNLISSIQNQVSKIVDYTKLSNISTEEQLEIVNNTENIFNNISNSITNLNFKIADVKKQCSEVNVKREDLMSVMETISAISEETAASTEEVLASSQEQKSTIEDLGTQTEALSELSNQLQNKINNFKVT